MPISLVKALASPEGATLGYLHWICNFSHLPGSWASSHEQLLEHFTESKPRDAACQSRQADCCLYGSEPGRTPSAPADAMPSRATPLLQGFPLTEPCPLLLRWHHDPVSSCVGMEDRVHWTFSLTLLPFWEFCPIQPGLATGEPRLLMCTATADFV